LTVRARLFVLAILVAGCGGGAPTAAPPTAGPSPAATIAGAPSATVPPPSAAPASAEPSVPEGFVRVTFKLKLTGGGSSAATMGVDVTEDGGETVSTILCSSPDGTPTCQENRTSEASFVFPEGATIEYVWFQELAPENRIYFQRNQFVADPSISEREITYDIQA
jgi:hypothetical protein